MLDVLLKLLKRKKRKKKEKEEEEVKPLEAELREWEITVEKVKNHPLSQAKVINTEILEVLTAVLRNIDAKLEKLDKLDEILELLREGRKELAEKGVKSEKIEQAIEMLEELSARDQEMIQLLEDRGPMTAEEIAEAMGMSRSTVSYRLNRLVKKGYLEKIPRGKRVFFKAKSD